ncbi:MULTISPECIES: hypothetical protein [unclassified Streptomyces]|jgi:hypothetical protein|uniref:hypothetical protein n=1 Tax=unclassified Streptomyces TaxID=2593676 RepID=UPI0040414AA6
MGEQRTESGLTPLAEAVAYWPEIQQAEPLLAAEIEAMEWEAEPHLTERDREMVRKMIVGACSAARAAGPDAVHGVLAPRKAGIEKYIVESAGIRARKRYAWGLCLGAIASIVLLIAVGLSMKDIAVAFRHAFVGSHDLTEEEFFALRDALACLGGGTIGAVLSVLLRMGTGLPVSYRTTSGRDAFFRIVLGWIFAAGIISLVKGHIVAVFPDPSEDLLKAAHPFADPMVVESFFFWIGVGILAGFNERWVKRLISQPVTDPKK